VAEQGEPHHLNQPDSAHPCDDADPSSFPTIDRPRSDAPPREVLPAPAADAPPAAGRSIGPFRIKRVIASGGMGTVYEARQESPRRIVAVKVLKRGLASRAALRRFEYESQILARLRHPNIAQVFEAGMHQEPDDPGVLVPYFAMEYIPGARPLTDYASAHDLSVDQRLDLFMRVCDAVHHGHQKGIIHRDLKPANILVDSSGAPKIIDFGVARSTDSDMAVTTIQTDVGQLIGTITYMSPEQCDADPNDLDTRSDVYALGVILYELLTGEMPYDLAKRPIHEAMRVIKEQRPARPSTTIRVLRGDLEIIMMKALEKDRERRYASALALSEDIARYRAKQPILARPPSVTYEVLQFARRNRLMVGAACAVLAALFIGGIATSIALGRALRAETALGRSLTAESNARLRAEQQARIASGINSFLNNDLLAAANPEYSANRELTVREALDAAASRIEGKFPDQPLIEAGIRHTIGAAYRSLGEPGLSETHLRLAGDLYEDTLGESDERTIAARGDLAVTLIDAAELAEADRILRRGLDIASKTYGEESAIVLSLWSNVATLRKYQGDLDESISILERILGEQRELLGDKAQDVLTTMNNLAIAYIDQSRYAEAEELLQACLEGCKAVHGENHPDTLSTLGNLGRVQESQGKYDEALESLEEAWTRQKKVLGPQHPYTVRTHSSIGVVHWKRNAFDEAERVFVENLDILRSTLGEDHPDTATARNNLAALYNETERYAEAEPLLKTSYDVQKRVLGPAHLETLNSMSNLAYCYDLQGKRDLAGPLYAEVLSVRRRVLGESNVDTMISMWNLGRFHEDGGDFDAAEPLLTEAADLAAEHLGTGHPYAAMFRAGVAESLIGRGRFEGVESSLTASIPVLQQTFGPEHDRTQRAIRALVRLYDETGRTSDAEHWRGMLAGQ